MTASRNEPKRQQIQDALDRFKFGQATQADFDTFLDRDLMYHATGDQASQFLDAAEMQDNVPLDFPIEVYVAWTQTLAARWKQSSRRRSSTPT